MKEFFIKNKTVLIITIGGGIIVGIALLIFTDFYNFIKKLDWNKSTDIQLWILILNILILSVSIIFNFYYKKQIKELKKTLKDLEDKFSKNNPEKWEGDFVEFTYLKFFDQFENIIRWVNGDCFDFEVHYKYRSQIIDYCIAYEIIIIGEIEEFDHAEGFSFGMNKKLKFTKKGKFFSKEFLKSKTSPL
ncbi:MAG: hypothetical protein KAT32_01855 [Candidatus Moranbacteria bacterium]|nr:hypothetical protein [Candidatus Moranbacteria bacterium]